MEKPQSRKWLLLLTLVLALGVLSAACSNNANVNRNSRVANNDTQSNKQTLQGTKEIEGYIVAYDQHKGTITIDPVEFLTKSRTHRISALGLDLGRDFENGYYVHNLDRNDTMTVELSSNLQVRLADPDRANDWADSWLMGLDSDLNTRTMDNGTLRDTTNDMGDALRDTVDGVGEMARDTVNNVGNVGDDLLRGQVGEAARDTVDGVGEMVRDAGDTIADLTHDTVHATHGLAGGLVGSIDLMKDRFMNGIDGTGNTPYFITIENGKVTKIEEVHAYSNYDPYYLNRY